MIKAVQVRDFVGCGALNDVQDRTTLALNPKIFDEEINEPLYT